MPRSARSAGDLVRQVCRSRRLGAWATALMLAAACQGAARDEERPESAARSGSDPDSGGHDQSEADQPPPISARADETARDVGEKPLQVMDELGIAPGAKVADVIAGGGYYTYLLSERVGPEGIVYATAAEGVARRLEEGDLRGRDNIQVVDDLTAVPPGTLDAVLINRAYHLVNQPKQELFPALHRALKPGGRIGVIEVRLSRPEGHDMKTHRMGERTVRGEVESGGFLFVGSSPLLANPDDPRTDFMEGKRHLADRMFLMFEKPREQARAR